MASADEVNGFGFHIVEDCELCDTKGKIMVFNELLNEEQEVDCPLCLGRGALRRKKL